MKKVVLLFGFWVIILYSFGQSAQGDEKELRGIIDTWIQGYNAGRPEAVASLYDENAYYLTQHYITGIVYGRKAIQSYVKNGTDAGYRVDSITITHLEIDGNMAWVIDRYYSDNKGTKASGVNLVVLKKIRGKWLIVAHEAAVPVPEEAVKTLEVTK